MSRLVPWHTFQLQSQERVGPETQKIGYDHAAILWDRVIAGMRLELVATGMHSDMTMYSDGEHVMNL